MDAKSCACTPLGFRRPLPAVDTADVRRGVVFGASQDGESAAWHCCVLWAALVSTDGKRVMLPRNRQTAPPPVKQAARSRRTNHKLNLLLLSFEKDLQIWSHQQRGKGSNEGSSTQRGKELCLLGKVSSSSALEVAGSLRSNGR